MKNIDNLFEEGLGGYTEAPPPAAWGALEKKLEIIPPAGVRPVYRWRWFIALIGLLLISIPGIKFLSAPPAGTETESAVTTIEEKPTNDVMSDTRLLSDATLNETRHATENVPLSNRYNTGNNGNHNIPANCTKQDPPGKPSHILTGTPIAKVDHRDKKHRIHADKNYNPIKNAISISGSTAVTNEEKQTELHHTALSNPAPAEEQEEDNTDPDTRQFAAKPKEDENSKKEEKQPITKNDQHTITPKRAKAKFNKWEGGVKIGYECGFDNDAAKKIVVSPYIQFNLSPKFAIMTQPSVKGGEIANRRIGKASSYYRANPDSNISVITPTYPVIIGENGNAEIYKTDYRYTQSYDSISKSYSIGGYYLEADIPLLLKYNVSKTFSVYAGALVAYSKQVKIEEKSYTKNNISTKPVDKYVITRAGEEPVPPPVNSVISFSGTPYSDYNGPAYTNTAPAAWRAGYMAGFSYEFSNRLMFDALVQQTNAKSNIQGGYNVNKTLSAPYIRITLGYKLLK